MNLNNTFTSYLMIISKSSEIYFKDICHLLSLYKITINIQCVKLKMYMIWQNKSVLDLLHQLKIK